MIVDDGQVDMVCFQGFGCVLKDLWGLIAARAGKG